VHSNLHVKKRKTPIIRLQSDPETDVPENRTRTWSKQIRRVEVVEDHESDIEESSEDSGTSQVPLNLPESGLFMNLLLNHCLEVPVNIFQSLQCWLLQLKMVFGNRRCYC
ncbi:unnamed protein product, partial [Allacma fusca]